MDKLNLIKEQVEKITELKIDTKSRNLETTLARWLYFKISRSKTKYNLSEIGSAVGRHYSTVVYGLKNIDYEINANEKLKDQYDRISTICGANLDFKKLSDIDKGIKVLEEEILKLLNIRREFENKLINEQNENKKTRIT